MNDLYGTILNFLFPKKCVGCQKVKGYFCDECVKTIEQKELICPFCKRLSINGATHPICRRRHGLDGLWSLGSFSPPLSHAIHKLKYRWVTELAEILADLNLRYWATNTPYLLDQIKKDNGKGWMVTPVPLHWARQNWRGFNQSALLGQLLAKKLGMPYSEYLKRIKNTTPQVKLSQDKRRLNIKGAFGLTNSHGSITSNIILIDDVWTTGSTLKECCYVLKRNGAKKVWALTLAR